MQPVFAMASAIAGRVKQIRAQIEETTSDYDREIAYAPLESAHSFVPECILECMRTNIVLDDELVREAMAISGARTKTAVVHEALRTLVEVRTAERRTSSYRDRLDRLGPRLRALRLRRPPSEVLREDRERA